MKKYLIIPIMAITFFALRGNALADSFTLAPTSTPTGSEGSVAISYASSQGYTNLVFYIFDNLGNSINNGGIEQTFSATFSSTWGTVGLPTSLTVGTTYTVLAIYEGSMGEYTGWSTCNVSSGGTLSGCESQRTAPNQYLAATETITAGGGGGGSSTLEIAPLNNRTSTAIAAGNVTSEIIAFPLYILETYGHNIVIMAIIFALVGAIYGVVKLVRL